MFDIECELFLNFRT